MAPGHVFIGQSGTLTDWGTNSTACHSQVYMGSNHLVQPPPRLTLHLPLYNLSALPNSLVGRLSDPHPAFINSNLRVQSLLDSPQDRSSTTIAVQVTLLANMAYCLLSPMHLNDFPPHFLCWCLTSSSHPSSGASSMEYSWQAICYGYCNTQHLRYTSEISP